MDLKRRGRRGKIGGLGVGNKGRSFYLGRDFLLCFLGVVSKFKLGVGESHWDVSLDVVLEVTNKAFTEEGVEHAFNLERQMLKRNNIFFHCTRIFKLGQTTQMMCVCVKAFIKVCNKLGPSKIPFM
jgi:hypothetical protein